MCELINRRTLCGILSLTSALMFGGDNAKGQPPPENKDATINLADLPTPYGSPFKVRPYLRAAVLLQKMGHDAACKYMAKLAERGDDGQIVILCRMLFSRKANGEFRPARLGEPTDYYGATELDDWPLFPIELVNGVPFLIIDGFNLAGSAESGRNYLDYCQKNCEWSKVSFDKVTDKTIENALQQLLASKKWKKPLTDDQRRHLSSQVK